MSRHKAVIAWKLESTDFSYENYNRSHEWRFENGTVIPASAAPDFRGTPDRVDPEEAYVAALSACHMLTFLAICARRGIPVSQYLDEAVGYLAKGPDGKLVITRVDLSPRILFGAEPPSEEELRALHEQSHGECFVANSVRTEIRVLNGF
ncbi:MAG TPA: OsmC family protein [Xanthomonadales bacterium]|nr:OsmC family protein [Xanthomonadales bacterium]